MSTAIEDAATRAVRWILNSPAFAGHEDRFPAFATADGWDFDLIRQDWWLWSDGQLAALRCAEAIQDGDDLPRSDVQCRMDEELRIRVVQAGQIARGEDPGELDDGLAVSA